MQPNSGADILSLSIYLSLSMFATVGEHLGKYQHSSSLEWKQKLDKEQ